MQDQKLENFEAINSLLMISIADIVLTSSRILIRSTSSSSIINSLFISIVAIIITFILCTLSKKFIGKNLIDIAEFLGGKYLKIIVSFGFISYFILVFGLFLRKTANSLQIIYYPLTNTVFIIILLTIPCGIIKSLKNNTVFKSTTLVVPIIYATIFLIFAGNAKNFNYNNIYPILGNGLNQTFFRGLTNLFTFAGLLYLFFLPPKLKHPEKFTKIGLIFTLLNGIYIIFCIADILLLFNDAVSHSELPPLYISVRYIEFGTFFQRMDAAFIFLCILGLISALSLDLTILLDIFKQTLSISDNKPLIFPCLLTAFGISLILKSNSTLNFLEDQLGRIYFLFFAILIPFIIIVGAVIKKNIINAKNEN